MIGSSLRPGHAQHEHSVPAEPELEAAEDGKVDVGIDGNDPVAFAALYQQHLPAIYRFLLARTLSPEDAADLSQQVFVKAFAALPDYRRTEVPISAWLFRIARNQAIDLARKHKRHPAISWEQLPGALEPVEPEQPEQAALRSESMRRLAGLVGQLDDQKRELILLRFVSGLKPAEIGRVVGKSDAAVRKQLRRTLQTLRERYDAE